MDSNITEANEIGSSSSCGTWSITEEEASYEYRLNSTWYTKAKVFDGYAHSAFVGFSQNRYNCHKINHIVDNVILPSLGVIGIIGNIFGIISFSKKAKQTYYFLLLTLAISDLITIIAFIVYYSFPHWHDHYTLLENPFYAYVILIAYGTLQVAQIVDIYLIIGLSIERYLAICHPLKYRSRKVSPSYYILLVIILSLCYTIPLCLEHYVGKPEMEKFENKNGSRQFMTNTTLYIIAHTDLKRESCTYLVIYDIIFKLITKCFIPYILLLTTNLLMVRTFCKLKQTPKKEEQEEEEPLNNIHENIVAQDSMRIHTNSREIKIRQSQINLGYLNLSISVVFLSCLSIRWSWALFDLQYYISQVMRNINEFYAKNIFLTHIPLNEYKLAISTSILGAMQ